MTARHLPPTFPHAFVGAETVLLPDDLDHAPQIVVATQDGFGYRPTRLLLPHQLSVDVVTDLLGGVAHEQREIWVAGVSSWVQIVGPTPWRQNRPDRNRGRHL